MDLTKAMVSQSVRTLGFALECQEALADIQSKNRASVGKLASTKEELKKIRAKGEEMKAQELKIQ